MEFFLQLDKLSSAVDSSVFVFFLLRCFLNRRKEIIVNIQQVLSVKRLRVHIRKISKGFSWKEYLVTQTAPAIGDTAQEF